MLNWIFAGIAIYMIVFLLEDPQLDMHDVANAIKWIFMIFPHYSLSDGLIFVNKNNTMRQTCSEMCEKNMMNMEPSLLCRRAIEHNVQHKNLCKIIAPNLPDFESFCYRSLRDSSQSQCEHVIELYTGCSLEVQCHRFNTNCCCKYTACEIFWCNKFEILFCNFLFVFAFDS